MSHAYFKAQFSPWPQHINNLIYFYDTSFSPDLTNVQLDHCFQALSNLQYQIYLSP